jgi:hypothetical protein
MRQTESERQENLWLQGLRYEDKFPDEFDPIPWFTEKDAQQALERMHAWASTSDPLMRLVWDLLDDTQRLNLARVAMELRPR